MRPATTRQCPLCYERIVDLTSPCSIAHDESLGDEDYALNDPDQLRPIFMVSYRVRYEVTHGHAFLLSLLAAFHPHKHHAALRKATTVEQSQQPPLDF